MIPIGFVCRGCFPSARPGSTCHTHTPPALNKITFAGEWFNVSCSRGARDQNAPVLYPLSARLKPKFSFKPSSGYLEKGMEDYDRDVLVTGRNPFPLLADVLLVFAAVFRRA